MFSHTEVLRTGLKLGGKQDLGRWKTVSLPSLLKLITQRSSAVGVGAIFPESAQLAAGVRAPPFTSHVVISLTSRCDAKREWHVCSERSKAH